MSEGDRAPPGLTQDEAFARIRLLRSPNIGPVTFMQLLRRFGTAMAAIEALPELAARGLSGRSLSAKAGARYAAVDEALVAAEVAAVRGLGARYLFHDAPDYPRLLRLSEGAPPILIVRGDTGLVRGAPVAMVGARNASAAAAKMARDLALDLAMAGHAVVSGLARGIDAAAHKGAMMAGRAGAGTVAVLAGGIDVPYPPEHAALLEDIAESGLVLTEIPPGVEPQSRHFPARNRIIAGLAAGTVVVEAAPRSGSLITARLAADYGREVMAIPGSPLDPRSHGCNELIRDGAMLVQRAADIIELVSSFDGVPRSTVREEPEEFLPAPLADEPEASAEAVERIAGLLGAAPVAVDELVRQSGAGAAAVQLALVELELAGRLVRHAGGRVSVAV